jgi:hypothetical protein
MRKKYNEIRDFISREIERKKIDRFSHYSNIRKISRRKSYKIKI